METKPNYQEAPGSARQVTRDRGLEAIAIFKLVKGLILVAVGVGALKLLHVDVYYLALHWLALLHGDPDRRVIRWLLVKLMAVDDRVLKELSAGTFVYAALLLTEGIGLMLEKTWAEYLTIVATAAFIPLEVYELAKHISVAKIVVAGVNVAVVWYLVDVVRGKRRRI